MFLQDQAISFLTCLRTPCLLGLSLPDVANVLYTMRNSPYFLHTMEINYKSTTLIDGLVVESMKINVIIFGFWVL
jgi:hypothetical protein